MSCVVGQHLGLARIPKVIYGASNQKFGGAGSLYDILRDERLNHRVEVETGVMRKSVLRLCKTFSVRVVNVKKQGQTIG